MRFAMYYVIIEMDTGEKKYLTKEGNWESVKEGQTFEYYKAMAKVDRLKSEVHKEVRLEAA